MDNKILAVSMTSKPSNKNKTNDLLNDIKYPLTKEEPYLSSKFSLGNIFLISCLNSFDQCVNNIKVIIDYLKDELTEKFFNSDYFDSKKIMLAEIEENEEMTNITYFK